MTSYQLTAFATTLLAVSSVAQTPSWTQITTPNTPSARDGHAMVYDSTRQKVVVFGGYAWSNHVNDTWEYDGINWTQVTTASSPSARGDHSMAYDSTRQKVVMFGGHDNTGSTILNDTWEYDGGNWTQITTASSPSARDNHVMTYDSTRQKVVMFGGYYGQAGSYYVNDTWEYDGVNWTEITTTNSPTARDRSAMVYDSARQKVVMFGGSDGIWGNGDDTWEYDGGNWTEVTTASSPSVRDSHKMAYDSARQKVVMFGGTNPATFFLNDIWEYDGGNWTQVMTASSPDVRIRHTMVYDSGRGKTVMFGGDIGSSVTPLVNDMWEYDGGTPAIATATIYGTGCGIPPLGFSPTSNPIIGTTASALISNAPTMFAGVTLGSSNTIFSGQPVLPYSLASLGMPGCYLLQSNDIFGLPVTPVTASTLQFDATIPFNTALLSQQFYIQAYALAPGANAAQIVTSNGIAWTIGNQ